MDLPNGPAGNRWNDFPELSATIDKTLFPTVTFIQVRLSQVFVRGGHAGQEISFRVLVDGERFLNAGDELHAAADALGKAGEELRAGGRNMLNNPVGGAADKLGGAANNLHAAADKLSDMPLRIPRAGDAIEGRPGVDGTFTVSRLDLLPGKHTFKVQYRILGAGAHVGPRSLSVFEIADCRSDLVTTFLETDKQLQSIRKEINGLRGDNEKMRQAFLLLDNEDVKKLLRAAAPESRTK